jgi:hypothetical protein
LLRVERHRERGRRDESLSLSQLMEGEVGKNPNKTTAEIILGLSRYFSFTSNVKK